MGFCPDIGQLPSCSVAVSYFRANMGMSILPWICSMILLIFHLPLVLIRVLKWETGQIWSLVMATFNVALTILAYASTKLSPAQIMVWIPVALIVDAGAMLQVFILILEEDGHRVHEYWKNFLRRSDSRSEASIQDDKPIEERPISDPSGRDAQAQEAAQHSQQSDSSGRDPRFSTLLLTLSTILFIAILSLQIIGLVSATHGFVGSAPQVQSYCSPAFVLGRTVYDVLCNNYTITPVDNGTGCIDIPGNQNQWLQATMATLIVEIILEMLDGMTLLLVNSNRHVREVKMKRPWCTMFFGVAAWAVFIAVGVYQTMEYPLPAHSIAIAGPYEQTCRAELYAAGLRGTIIAWSDGIFAGLGSTYFGPAGGE